MALSANTFYRMTKGLPSIEVEILNTQVMFHGAYAAVGHVDHGTAGNRGRLFEFNDNIDGVIPLGFMSQKSTGDTGATRDAKRRKGLAVLIKPFSVGEIRAAVERGGLLPQKSTYFYPKIAAGLVFRENA